MTDVRLQEYVSLWERQAVRMSGSGGASAPRRDLDLNVGVPASFHFGPPPVGWGEALSGLSSLAAYDPTRAQGTGGFWSVSTRWVQEKLRLAGYQIAADGVYGVRTGSALLSFIRDRLRLQVRSFSSNLTSIDTAVEALPVGYQFGRGTTSDRMVVGHMLERFLEPLTRDATPPPPVVTEPPAPPPVADAGSSGVGVALPLLFVGVGLAFLFSRR